MQQDIREKLKDFQEQNIELSANHASKFENLLKAELHSKKNKNCRTHQRIQIVNQRAQYKWG